MRERLVDILQAVGVAVGIVVTIALILLIVWAVFGTMDLTALLP